MMKDEDATESSNSDSSNSSSTLETVIERKPATTAIRSGRSCTGCLYHSSYRNDHGRNPLCVGFSRSEKQAYTVENPHLEALNDEKRLLEFKYACLGYSVYKQNASSTQERRVELPACLGIEMQLLDPSKAPRHTHQPVPSQLSDQAGAHDEGAPVAARPPPPPPPSRRPELSGPRGDEFATRFFRTAGLIATAVGHNLSRVAGSIKTGLDDIFYPDRRRPK